MLKYFIYINFSKLLLVKCLSFEIKYKDRIINGDYCGDLDSHKVILRHSDGWKTFVSKEFWDEIKEIDMIKLLKNLSLNSAVYYIRPKNDEIFENACFDDIKNLNNINYLELPGDHNFSGKTRQTLIKTIKEIFLRN